MEVKERGKVFAYCGILFLMLGMALLVLFGGDVLASATDGAVDTYATYTTLTFQKEWVDEDGVTPVTPDGVTEIEVTAQLEFLNTGKTSVEPSSENVTKTITFKLTAADNWTYTVPKSAIYIGPTDRADEYGYVKGSIKEIEVNGYTYAGEAVDRVVTVDKQAQENREAWTITLTNEKKPEPKYTAIQFKKVWADEEGDTSKRPEEITFTVDLEYLNGAVDSSKPAKLEDVPITLTEAGNWVFTLPETYTADGETYNDLDEYKPVDGSISEVKVDGYTCESAAVTDDGNGNYTVTLKNAKVPEPTPKPEPTPDNKPTPEPEPTPDNEPTPEPEPTPDNEPTPEPEPTPDNKPTPEPEPTPDNKPTPEPTPVTTPAPTPVPEEPALETPKTGDSTDATVWMLPTFGGAAGLTAVLLYRRRHAAGKR